MFNITKLYYGHLKNTKKIIFISTIGLICAITIVSSSFIYIDSTKNQVVSELITANGSNSPFDLQLNYQTPYPKENVQSIDKELRNMTSNLITQSNLDIFQKLELYYFASGLSTNGSYFNGTGPVSTTVAVTVVQLNDALKSDLTGFLNATSLLPASNSTKLEAFELQTLFTGPNDPSAQFYTTHDIVNNSSDLGVTLYANNQSETQSFNFNITGRGKIISKAISMPGGGYQMNYMQDTYPTLSKFWRGFGSSDVYLFVNNLTYFLNLLQPINSFSSFNFKIFGGLNIDLNKIDAFTVASRVQDIQDFVNNFQTKFYNTNFAKSISQIQSNSNPNQPKPVPIYSSYLNFNFQNSYVYQEIAGATNTILFNMLLYAIPILIVALFMTNYSFGLIHKEVVRHIGIYKTRGASHRFMLAFEFFDFILILVLATLAGMLAGVPIASVVSKTDFLLSFNSPKNYDIVSTFITNLNSLTINLLLFGILISMVVNLRRTLRLASIAIVDTEDPSEKTDPYWKRHYLDVILFLYGLISYLSLVYIISDQTNGLAVSPLIIIFLYLSLPSPFAMVIGTILLLNRLTPLILNSIGTKLWHRNGGLLAFSFKNVIRHRQASTRAIMLIAALLTFLLLFYSYPYSQVNYDQQVTLYQNGAEAVLNVPIQDSSNLTSIRLAINNVTSTLSENFSTVLAGYSPFIVATNYNDPHQPTFTFINTSTFLNASSINQFNPGLEFSLQKDLNTLHKMPDSLIIDQHSFNSIHLKVNDTIDISSGFSGTSNFPVIDSFKIWPGTSQYFYGNSMYAISDIGNILNSNTSDISNTVFSQIQSVGFYLNFKDGVNITQTTSEIAFTIQSSVRTSNFNSNFYDIFQKLTFQFQLGQINTNVILSIIIGVIILIMFAYMQLNDRRREIYTERALGMKLRQTGVLFFIEGILLLATGMVIGTVLGTFFLSMIAIFMTQGSQIPPYVVLIPWDLVIITYIGLLILSVLSAVIPAYYVTKQDISQSFGEA